MLRKTKLLLPIFLIAIMFSGCFGGDDNNENISDNSGKTLYDTNAFSIYIPQDWDILEEADFPSTVPSETIVVFRNNIKNEIFTANVNISLLNTPENFNSSDLAKNSKSKIKSELVSFNELDSKNIEVTYAEGTIPATIILFEGKKSPSDPIIIFKQLYVVYQNTGYMITAAYLPEEDESVVKYTDEMLDSFTLK